MVSTADSYHLRPGGGPTDASIRSPAMRTEVWAIGLEQPADVVARLGRYLDADEVRAATARRAPGAHDRYVVGHGALREILAALTAMQPTALRFDRRCRHCGDPAHGKPELAHAPDLSFSLSHSASVALVAVAREARVGVDVEVIRARRQLEKLAARVLTPDEFQTWRVVPPASRVTAFLRGWTAKEAYLKALGLGLVRPLRTVPVAPDGWSVLPVAAGREVVASIAVEGALAVPPVVATWDPEREITLDAAW
jgi:4'-phosphopantetheinyl transferase